VTFISSAKGKARNPSKIPLGKARETGFFPLIAKKKYALQILLRVEIS